MYPVSILGDMPIYRDRADVLDFGANAGGQDQKSIRSYLPIKQFFPEDVFQILVCFSNSISAS